VKQLRVIFIVCLLFALAMVSSGCSEGANEANAGETKATTTENLSSGAKVGSKVGEVAPNFVLKDLNGALVDLKDLRGKVVLIDFWDTWCPPCIKALPHLEELHLETKDENVIILAVAVGRNGESAVQSFIKKHGYTFTTVMGDKAAFEAYKLSGIPATFVLGPDGVIHSAWVGGKSKKEYADAVHAAAGH